MEDEARNAHLSEDDQMAHFLEDGIRGDEAYIDHVSDVGVTDRSSTDYLLMFA